MQEKILFTWSGGKDSALALYELMKNDRYEISALVTTITKDYDRISMHGVRTTLLDLQAESIGIKLEKVFITQNASNDEYEKQMKALLIRYKDDDIQYVAFGDIFLEDLRRYREDNLAKVGMKALFPIWKIDTKKLAHDFISTGFRAVVTCVDTNVLEAVFAGREYDIDFLAELPSSVDPCGENGEFHTFVYDGPIFKKSIDIVKGEKVLRESRFYYCDILSIEGQ
jgi:uncharacterized protein (TIGR00290 family)